MPACSEVTVRPAELTKLSCLKINRAVESRRSLASISRKTKRLTGVDHDYGRRRGRETAPSRYRRAEGAAALRGDAEPEGRDGVGGAARKLLAQGRLSGRALLGGAGR